MKRILIALVLLAASATSEAACINKFVSRPAGAGRSAVTLLTGTLTYDEAIALSNAIKSKSAPPLEWIDGSGKVLSRQVGELKVIRPMPTSCEGKPSGVVVSVTFLTVVNPTGTLRVKLADGVIVTFDEQS